jgi:hypothetical protein
MGLLKKSAEIEILILGNSRSDNGLNPIFFRRPAYNMAYGSQTISYDKELLIKYLPLLKKLKYVILPFDYHTLYSGYLEERDFFYFHYHGINIKNRQFVKENLSYFFYVYSTKVAIKLLQENKKADMIDGWTGNDSSIFSRLTDRYGKERAMSFDLTINQSIASNEHIKIKKEYEDLIRFLNQKNIFPILVTAPCYESFSKYLNKDIINGNNEFIQNLQKKYKLLYVDLLNDSSFNKTDFFNNDHVNKKGAMKYTRKVDSLIYAQGVN